MFSRQLLLAALSAAALLSGFLGNATVDVPAPNITVLDSSSMCIPPIPAVGENDTRVNVSLHCEVSPGSVVWLIGDYPMVDRDQFEGKTYGVHIEDSAATDDKPYTSGLTLFPTGAEFLLDSFQALSFNITCQTVLREINTQRSDVVLTFYYPFVEEPQVSVTGCTDDGKYIVSLAYKRFPDSGICTGGIPDVFSITIPGGSCDGFEEEGEYLKTECSVEGSDDLVANLTGYEQQELLSPLSSALCGSPTWGMCSDIITPNCDFQCSTECWVASDSNGSAVFVTDGMQSCPAQFDENFSCAQSCAASDLSTIGVIAALAIAAFVVGLVLVLAIALPIIWCRRGKKSGNTVAQSNPGSKENDTNM